MEDSNLVTKTEIKAFDTGTYLRDDDWINKGEKGEDAIVQAG